MLLQGHLVRLPKRHQRGLLRTIVHDSLLLSVLPFNELLLLCLSSFPLLVEVLSPLALPHLALFLSQAPEILEGRAGHRYCWLVWLVFLDKVWIPLISLMNNILIMVFEAIHFGCVLVLEPFGLLFKLFLGLHTAFVNFLPHKNDWFESIFPFGVQSLMVGIDNAFYSLILILSRLCLLGEILFLSCTF